MLGNAFEEDILHAAEKVFLSRLSTCTQVELLSFLPLVEIVGLAGKVNKVDFAAIHRFKVGRCQIELTTMNQSIKDCLNSPNVLKIRAR